MYQCPGSTTVSPLSILERYVNRLFRRMKPLSSRTRLSPSSLKLGTYTRILFVDFSSAFNTIIPDLLHNELSQLSVPPSAGGSHSLRGGSGSPGPLPPWAWTLGAPPLHQDQNLCDAIKLLLLIDETLEPLTALMALRHFDFLWTITICRSGAALLPPPAAAADVSSSFFPAQRCYRTKPGPGPRPEPGSEPGPGLRSGSGPEPGPGLRSGLGPDPGPGLGPGPEPGSGRTEACGSSSSLPLLRSLQMEDSEAELAVSEADALGADFITVELDTQPIEYVVKWAEVGSKFTISCVKKDSEDASDLPAEQLKIETDEAFFAPYEEVFPCEVTEQSVEIKTDSDEEEEEEEDTEEEQEVLVEAGSSQLDGEVDSDQADFESDERQYRCSYCRKCYSHASSLYRHQQTHTGKNAGAPPPPRAGAGAESSGRTLHLPPLWDELQGQQDAGESPAAARQAADSPLQHLWEGVQPQLESVAPPPHPQERKRNP
ncbi:uncharacterized protein LOC133966537 [Platichthys flesus]|uniref:uncharacterized protein LOC133966537 n=1 Tax=Platichthys flesus TaxID=8260 RepID=UPI002DB5EB1E|nr:uncharacterized protein LOC133966537 [Platichthys flesus]